MASVTLDRIDALRRHVADAVTQTSPAAHASPGSALPQQEQDRLLDQACTEACELIGDWLDIQQAQIPAAGDVPLRELLQDQQQFTAFLSPLFADVLDRAATASGVDDACHAELVQRAQAQAQTAIRAAMATARRHPRWRASQLREAATEHVTRLRNEVCQLAQQFAAVRQQDKQARAAWRDRAIRALKKVGGFLIPLSVSLVLSVGGPGQVARNVETWLHAGEVVISHELAAQAQPGVTLALHPAGPHPH